MGFFKSSKSKDEGVLQVKLEEFEPSLAEVVRLHKLDWEELGVPCIDRNQPYGAPATIPRTTVFVADPKKAAVWETASLRALFRGNKVPPSLEQYPPEYVPLLYFIERHVLSLCKVVGEKTDGEFEEWYSNLRRRPDGRSLGEFHDYLWRVCALLLAMRPTSQAEFEAVIGRLARSASTFRMGHASRFYMDYLNGRLTTRATL
jgi:hypothetical protein